MQACYRFIVVIQKHSQSCSLFSFIHVASTALG
ncbi:unnamed protein product [Spirodela intermedia]|uniref:Uncharacterized protein n=1 Tax=Spirodela intermedia TaxID=51605 RepID=A0A7I8KY74_SPIIN|nr:unnamed protein product [Spirodela intermedia]